MKWLKYFREKSDLSMNKLSELLHVKLNTIWRWENGRASPSVDMARELAKILNVTETELLNGPVSNDWELRIKISKEKVIEVGNIGSSAEINVGDTAMAITLSADYDLWEDDAKFEGLVEQLRTKRKAALKLRKESW